MSNFDDKVTSSRYSDKNGTGTDTYRNTTPENEQYYQDARYSQAPRYNQAPRYSQDPRYNQDPRYYQDPRYSQNAGSGNGQYYRQDRQGGGRRPSGQGRNGAAPRSRERDRSYGDRPDRRGAAPQRRKRRKGPVILIILLLLILAAAGTLFLTLGKIKTQKLKDLIVNTGISSGSGYRNIVLYGVDSREGKLTQEAHSDTIMICSIQKRTKKVKLVSVYRDTYLDNTNGEYRKATECYYFGGPERSVNMLNKNLDLDISDYITVDFGAVIEIVDALGGIELEITPEEMEYINGYCVENNQVTGVSYTPLTTSGYVHLDGIQALAYCRIRYTEGWDYKRTERQRTVLTLCYQKAKQKGLPGVLSALNAVLPKIATSMGTAELISLVTTLAGYDISEEAGFPFDQTPAMIDGSDVVVPMDLTGNVSKLHAFLFDENDYVPSQTVQEISSVISSRLNG